MTDPAAPADEPCAGPAAPRRARPPALARPRRHRGRPADDRPRRVDREHRAAVRPGRPRHHRRRTGSGWSRPTRWPSAACCCSAAGSPTTPAASARSSSACSASPAPPRSAASPPNQELLFAARALQGAFAALMAPAALSLVTVTFTEPKERAKAFGVFGALAGGGAAIGLIVGGVLTEYASWRWCLGVNVPVALLVAGPRGPARAREQGARRHPLRHPRRPARDARPGLPGLRLHRGRQAKNPGDPTTPRCRAGRRRRRSLPRPRRRAAGRLRLSGRRRGQEPDAAAARSSSTATAAAPT